MIRLRARRRIPRVEQTEPPQLPDGQQPVERRGRPLVRAAIAVVVLAGLVLGGWLITPRSPTDSGDSVLTTQTATSYSEVVLADLSEVTSLDGTLAYTSDRTIVNRAGGSSAGGSAGTGGTTTATLTAIAQAGQAIERGGTLYRVDDRPVVLLYGKTPAWRTMGEGVDGKDVRQLQTNLKALGFDAAGAMTVDGDFGSSTKDAVEAWQASVGAEDDGVVELGEVVFLPGAVRVDEQLSPVGSSAGEGTQILAAGSTAPVVRVNLESDQLNLLAVGDEITVELSNGEDTTGTVGSIGGLSESGGASTGSTESSTTLVTISLDHPQDAAELAGTSVTVKVVTDERADVLAVPVTALLAIQGGGYAVQVDRGGRTEAVRVDTGLFDDARGLVEVASNDLRPGDRVVVASS